MFSPRTTEEILKGLMARVQARTVLDDLRESGTVMGILSSIAEEFSATDFRLQTMLNAFAFDPSLTGKDLDDRAAQLPGLSPPGRLPASFAAGSILTLIRGGDLGVPLLVPAGALFGRSDGSATIYKTTQDYTFNAGIDTISALSIIATVAGTAGNCEPDTITTIVSAPSDVIAVTNADPLSNGANTEGDDLFLARCLLYLGSLSGCQPLALEYTALSFLSSQGTRVRYAKVFEDPLRKGYSEIVVDDGTGLAASSAAGVPIQGIVPASGSKILWHQAPATEPISAVKVETLDAFGVVIASKTFVAVAPGKSIFTSVPERGVVYFPPGTLDPGQRWTISDYSIFVGLIAELQKFIDGDPSDPSGMSGRVAAGTSVRVVPPTVSDVGMAISVVPYPSASFESTSATVATNAVNYLASLAPGETLYVSRLEQYLLDADPTNLKAVTIYKWTGSSNMANLVRFEDISPPDLRHVLRTSTSLIKLIKGA